MLRRSYRWLLLAAILGGGAWLFLSGAYRNLQTEAMRDSLRSLGALGPVVFVLAYALLQPLGPSGHLFVLAASLVWSAPLAFGLSVLGGLLGHSLFFVMYRYLFADFARARIPRRLHRFDHALATRPFLTVLTLRLLTFTWPIMPALLAASRVRFWPMFVATALGIAPMTALDVWLGEKLWEYLLAA